jgi:alpha-galactosidase
MSPTPERQTPWGQSLASTPPMGWSTWNHFKGDISDGLIRQIADSLVSTGLAAAGYRYVNVDDLWQVAREDGALIADPEKFPNGIEDLASYVHSKGLKFGIYTCAGSKTCEGRPGSLGYEAKDIATFANWGVDFVKVDWCHSDGLDARRQYDIFHHAIEETNRPMILSICEWGKNQPWIWGRGVGELWRISSDARGVWKKIITTVDRNSGLFSFAGPGGWNDPDLLEIGNRHLSRIEQETHFFLWVIMAAPLILGNDVRTIDQEAILLLTNPESLAINQDLLGAQGRIVLDFNFESQVWVKPLESGATALLLINSSDETRVVQAKLADLNLPRSVAVRDVGNRVDVPIGSAVAYRLHPHESRLLKATPL